MFLMAPLSNFTRMVSVAIDDIHIWQLVCLYPEDDNPLGCDSVSLSSRSDRCHPPCKDRRRWNISTIGLALTMWRRLLSWK